MILKTNLKELREQKNMSQTELAEKSGISRVTINKIENDNIETLMTTTVIKLCDTLGCNIGEFFLR